eukprot:7024303-Prymnesium_polylepis.1
MAALAARLATTKKRRSVVWCLVASIVTQRKRSAATATIEKWLPRLWPVKPDGSSEAARAMPATRARQ